MVTDRFSAVVAVLLSPQVQAAIAAGATGSVIRLARQAHRWRQRELADRSGYSQATISRVERGMSRAARDTAVLTDLADVLGVPPAVLGITGAPQQRPTLEEVKRRRVLEGATGLAVTALLPRNVAAPGRIDAAEVTQCWSALHRLYQLDDQHGGGTVCQLTEAMAGRLRDAVRRGSYSPEVGRELQNVTAAAMEHVAWVSYDAGRQHQARHWWLETCHFADVHEVPDVRVTALASMSLHAANLGDGAETVGLVQAVRKTATRDHGGSPLLLSLLAAREAVGHALLGDRNAAASAMGQAHQWLDRGRRGDEPFWLDFWGPADLAAHEKRVALLAGQGKSAEVAARAALATVDAVAFPRNRISYAASLGSVLTQRGQFDEAISVLSEAIQGVHAGCGSGRIITRLHRTVDLLGRQKYPPARSFATAAHRLLPTAT